MHRDIKPENMLLTGDYQIRLADFGLAIDTALESPMSRVGTLDYMPPEVSQGGVGWGVVEQVGLRVCVDYMQPKVLCLSWWTAMWCCCWRCIAALESPLDRGGRR